MTLQWMSDDSGTAAHEAWSLPAADAFRGHRALWWSAGPAGELAVMLVHRRHLERSRYGKGWHAWRPKNPFTGELVTVTAQGERRTTVENVRIRPSHLALLPDSRFLLVNSRTPRPGADGLWGANAVVFSPSGTPENEFCVGDDIPALITDRHGGIWTAYGDEGIYGGHPGSGAGLAGWDTGGRATWAPGDRLPAQPLEGCTAATEGDRVWLVWYTRVKTRPRAEPCGSGHASWHRTRHFPCARSTCTSTPPAPPATSGSRTPVVDTDTTAPSEAAARITAVLRQAS
ncbi:hypothetical protein RKD28_006572 [Streptomyces sp. SAI-229]